MRRKTIGAAGALFAGFFLVHDLLWAGPPTQQVRSTVESVYTGLLNSRQESEAKRKKHAAAIKQAIARRFDFAEMAKRALGPYWERRSARERSDYVKIFTDVAADAYVDQIEPFAGERILYLRESRDGDFAEVDTKALGIKGDELDVNYKLRSRGGEWKVYDLVIENVSVVNNYRAQFARIMNRGSFDDLLEKLRDAHANQMLARQTRPGPTLLSAWLLAQAAPNRPR
ncbi:MAG TPA: ABC transporter substrate-binding protein [Candidatus Binatia bacterium]|nr:ABC transporter substrate-binding protein [Candidatus Binatia bacterium]